jgi:hypothetical protein
MSQRSAHELGLTMKKALPTRLTTYAYLHQLDKVNQTNHGHYTNLFDVSTRNQRCLTRAQALHAIPERNGTNRGHRHRFTQISYLLSASIVT